MAKFKDEEGNEIEGLTTEEANKLADERAAAKVKEAEEAAAKKLAENDENWKKHLAEKTQQIKLLKDMSDADKAKLSAKEIEDMKAREAMMSETESTKKELEEMKKREIDNYKTQALDALGVYDDEERKKVLLNYDRILGDMKTPEEVRSKMMESVNMLGIRVSQNPLFRAPGSTGSFPSAQGGKAQRYSDTPEGRELAEKLNMRFIKEDGKK